MADLIDRPASAVTPVSRAITPAPSAEVAVDKLLTTRSPQRPQRTPTFYVEIDGQKLEAFEGQTILEVCRANGLEVPTLCYDPKLPGFGACRMCVVDVEGCDQPSISCSAKSEPAQVVATQTDRIREIRRTNLELIFSDHNAYCLPPCQNKCPSHIDIPGFLKFAAPTASKCQRSATTRSCRDSAPAACALLMLKGVISRPSAVQPKQSRLRSYQRRPIAFARFAAPTLS